MHVSTQLLGLGRLQKKEKKSLMRRNLARESSGHYAYREMNDSEKLGDDGKGRRKKAKFGAARKVHQLNLWYFTSTISHILRKAKAFYNECCCDAYEDGRMNKVEGTLVNPYFSMPVLPYG